MSIQAIECGKSTCIVSGCEAFPSCDISMTGQDCSYWHAWGSTLEPAYMS